MNGIVTYFCFACIVVTAIVAWAWPEISEVVYQLGDLL